MKFLVLALCVCAASAASFGSAPFGAGGNKAFKGFQNTAASPAVYTANVVTAPAVVAAKAVASVAAPVADAAAATYQAAKQVFNQAYESEGVAAILRSESEVGSNGYNYIYETTNGISSQASGAYKQVGESGAVVSQGSYQYTAPDGTPVVLTYTADENGYHPTSDVLPVGPPIPDAIARSLIYIAEKTRAAVQKQ